MLTQFESGKFCDGMSQSECLDVLLLAFLNLPDPALAMKRERGERIGSVPYGYMLGKDGVHLVANVKEAEAAALARRWKRRGRSLRQIAAALSERGIRSRAGGALWPASIQAMLRRVS